MPGKATLWLSALIAGLVAGLAAWLIGEATHGHFEPEEVKSSVMGREASSPTTETKNAALIKNGMVAFGALGAALGVALGMGAGLAGRAARPAATAAAVGLLAGGLAGVGAAAVVLPPTLRNQTFRQDDLIRPFLTHAGLWAPLGAAGGLAFGLGAGRRRMAGAALGGAVGALLGTAAYELIGGLAFPLAQTDAVLSVTSTTRLIARLCVSLGAAAGAVLGSAGSPGASRPGGPPS